MFNITQKRNNWIMTCEQGWIHDKNHQGGVSPTGGWTQIIEQINQELEPRTDVRRMGYDTWYWKNKDALDTWLTYWYLKFPIKDFRRIKDITGPAGKAGHK